MNKHENYSNKKPTHAQSLNLKEAERDIETPKTTMSTHTANEVLSEIKKGFNNGKDGEVRC